MLLFVGLTVVSTDALMHIRVLSYCTVRCTVGRVARSKKSNNNNNNNNNNNSFITKDVLKNLKFLVFFDLYRQTFRQICLFFCYFKKRPNCSNWSELQKPKWHPWRYMPRPGACMVFFSSYSSSSSRSSQEFHIEQEIGWCTSEGKKERERERLRHSRICSWQSMHIFFFSFQVFQKNGIDEKGFIIWVGERGGGSFILTLNLNLKR